MSEDGLVPRDTRVFKCEDCGKDYGQGEIAQHSLQRHIQSNHLRKYLFFYYLLAKRSMYFARRYLN